MCKDFRSFFVCASVNNFFFFECFCYLKDMLWLESWESILWEMWKYVGAPLWIAGHLVRRLWLAVQNCDAYLCMFVVFVFFFFRWPLGKCLARLPCIKIAAEAICQGSVLQACPPPFFFLLWNAYSSALLLQFPHWLPSGLLPKMLISHLTLAPFALIVDCLV